MSVQHDSREITILESKGILIKDQLYHVVLTDRRVIFTSFFDHKPRSINLPDVQKTELAINDYGDPIIIIFLPSVAGEIKKVILHFSRKNFPDPRQVSSLWSSEINKMIQRIVPVSSDIPPKVSPGITPKVSPDITPKVSPGITPKKGSPILAFCVTCGKKFVDGSVFCNKCGTKIIYPVHPLPPVQGIDTPVKSYNTPVRSDDIIKDEVKTPGISMQKIDPPKKKISPADTDDSDTKEKVPPIASLPKKQGKKKSFFAGSNKRKPAVIVVSALVCVIIVIAAFLVVLPSVAPRFNLTFPGMNFTVPGSNDMKSDNKPLADTTPISETNGAPEIPEQTPVPEVPFSKPAIASVPGDPASVLVSYPSLFNSGNIAGLSALSSENLKSYSPIVNSELAAARSNGIIIDKIQVNNQIIEENSAILEADILWMVAGSPVTSSPRFFLVYEGNQWKLDSLVVSPYVS